MQIVIFLVLFHLAPFGSSEKEEPLQKIKGEHLGCKKNNLNVPSKYLGSLDQPPRNNNFKRSSRKGKRCFNRTEIETLLETTPKYQTPKTPNTKKYHPPR